MKGEVRGTQWAPFLGRVAVIVPVRSSLPFPVDPGPHAPLQPNTVPYSTTGGPSDQQVILSRQGIFSETSLRSLFKSQASSPGKPAPGTLHPVARMDCTQQPTLSPSPQETHGDQ